jgi:polysaccharide pyruvyl transferase CsaB
LAGYFGFGNAGDEMILASLLRHVRSVSWTVLSAAPSAAPPAASLDFLSINRWDAAGLARLFRRSRALVLGGGELFQARTSWKSFFYYAALVAGARLCRCDVWAFGMGVDEKLPRVLRALLRVVMNGARGLWARDAASARLLGGRSRPVAPDPVWTWPVDSVPPPSRLRKILWVLRESSAEDADLWARALNGLSEAAPWEHGFMAFHPSQDLPFLARVRARLGFFHRLETWTRLPTVFEKMAAYDAVVSMRFHGLVAAALMTRPSVAVAAHGKVTRLGESLGRPVTALGDVTAESLEAAIRQAWRAPVPAVFVADQRAQARKALSALDSALAGNRSRGSRLGRTPAFML